jgi:hypothetical protein
MNGCRSSRIKSRDSEGLGKVHVVVEEAVCWLKLNQSVSLFITAAASSVEITS